MSLKAFWDFLFKVLNVLFVLVGLGMIGYGIYLFVATKSSGSSGSSGQASAPTPSGEFIQLGRPMMITVASAHNFLDKLPKSWFIFLFIIIGIILIATAACGFIGVRPRAGACCLITYLVVLILMILLELAFAAFVIFDKSWKEDLPTDKTGTVYSMARFVKKNRSILIWVALAILAVQIFVFVVALIERFVNKRDKRKRNGDGGEEYVAIPKHQLRQPLVNNNNGQGENSSSEGGRNDGWTSRMKEKVGTAFKPKQQQDG